MLAWAIIRPACATSAPSCLYSTTRLAVLRERLVELADSSGAGTERLPAWLKAPIPQGKKYTELESSLAELKLNTVKRAQKSG